MVTNKTPYEISSPIQQYSTTLDFNFAFQQNHSEVQVGQAKSGIHTNRQPLFVHDINSKLQAAAGGVVCEIYKQNKILKFINSREQNHSIVKYTFSKQFPAHSKT